MQKCKNAKTQKRIVNSDIEIARVNEARERKWKERKWKIEAKKKFLDVPSLQLRLQCHLTHWHIFSFSLQLFIPFSFSPRALTLALFHLISPYVFIISLRFSSFIYLLCIVQPSLSFPFFLFPLFHLICPYVFTISLCFSSFIYLLCIVQPSFSPFFPLKFSLFLSFFFLSLFTHSFTFHRAFTSFL